MAHETYFHINRVEGINLVPRRTDSLIGYESLLWRPNAKGMLREEHLLWVSYRVTCIYILAWDAGGFRLIPNKINNCWLYWTRHNGSGTSLQICFNAGHLCWLKFIFFLCATYGLFFFNEVKLQHFFMLDHHFWLRIWGPTRGRCCNPVYVTKRYVINIKLFKVKINVVIHPNMKIQVPELPLRSSWISLWPGTGLISQRTTFWCMDNSGRCSKEVMISQLGLRLLWVRTDVYNPALDFVGGISGADHVECPDNGSC